MVMLNFLKEYRRMEKDKEFLSAVNACLFPFVSARIGEKNVMSGEQMAEVQERANPVGWNRIPEVVREMIKASNFSACQELEGKGIQVIWFTAENMKGFYVIRYYITLPAGYKVSKYGTAYNEEEYNRILNEIKEADPADPKIAYLSEDLRSLEEGKQYNTAEAAKELNIENGWLQTYYKNGTLEYTVQGIKEKSPRRVSQLFIDEFKQKAQWETLEKAQPTKIYKQYPLNIFGRPKRSGPYSKGKQ